jgi:hypothetical protein
MPTAKTKSKANTKTKARSKSKANAKPPAKQTRLIYPATKLDDMRRFRQNMEEHPMWAKNMVYRRPITRRSANNNTLLLNRDLKQYPIYDTELIHRPSRTRKLGHKHRPIMKKTLGNPLGIKI